MAETSGSARQAGTERRVLASATSAHALHDGYTDVLYLLLPVWQAEFGLGFAEVGLLRSSYTAVMAVLQVPASMLAERVGPVPVLVGGTMLAAACFLLAGASTGLAGLAVALAIGGVGASVQHPIGSSIVSDAYHGARSRAALGIYNFTGDVGKVAMPLLVGGLLALMTWREATLALAALGSAVAILVAILAPRRDARSDAGVETASIPPAAPAPTSRGFKLLLAIGAIDNASRSAFLTFLPFLLQTKGASLTTIGLALSLVLGGGAAGKLACGYIGARLGVLPTVLLTEGLTALGILALLPLRLDGALLLLPLIGIALNGTSSVLYGTVPELVAPAARTRAFGIFYTGTIAASAAAPPLMGIVGDAFGTPLAMTATAAAVLLTIPLAIALNPSLPRLNQA